MGTMTVGPWWENKEGRSVDCGCEADQTWVAVERQGLAEVELVGVMWEYGYLWCRGDNGELKIKGSLALF